MLVRAMRSASVSVVDETAPMMEDRCRSARGSGASRNANISSGGTIAAQLALGEVAPLADSLPSQSTTDDLARAARLEAGDEVRADEAGAAGDDDHVLLRDPALIVARLQCGKAGS
jgi:hypothetical protein